MDANGPESLALGEPRAERGQHPIDELLPVRVVPATTERPSIRQVISGAKTSAIGAPSSRQATNARRIVS